MGLFDRLFGRRPAARPPAPPILGEVGGFVMINQGAMTTLMDRETYEYMYGDSGLPDPTQADLDRLLAGVTRVRVLAGGLQRGASTGTDVLADTTDPAVLTRLAAALRIIDRPPFDRCACHGGPTIELFAGDRQAATLGLQHGQAVRWVGWKPDARLADGGRLTDWLVDAGAERPLIDMLFHNQYPPTLFPRPGVTLTRAEQRLRVADAKCQGDPAGAIADCDRELAADPELGYGYFVRGLARHAADDHPGAVADLTAALARGCESFPLRFTRGVSRDMLGQPELALEDLDRAVELDPTASAGWNSRGTVRSRHGDVGEAIADLNRAIELSPDWWMPRLNRAQAHLRQGDPAAAIPDFTAALDGMGKDGKPNPRVRAMLLWNRGECYRRTGDAKRADADQKAAERLQSTLGPVGDGPHTFVG